MRARPSKRLTRSAFLRRAAAMSGLGLAGAAVVVGPASSASPTERDNETLAYLLELEDLQAAFYADALDRGALTGEAQEFAEVVGGHERDHVEYLRGALGGGAPAGLFDFGDTTGERGSFLRTAVVIEETGLAAYTGAAINLSAGVLGDAARLVSVEARHTAWARDLIGQNPAPDASDKPATEAETRAVIRRTGFARGG